MTQQRITITTHINIKKNIKNNNKEELDVLAAQELQWMERRFRFNSRGSYTKGSSKFNNSIGHTYFKVFVFNFLTNSIFKFSKY